VLKLHMFGGIANSFQLLEQSSRKAAGPYLECSITPDTWNWLSSSLLLEI
jgi:hypothetical protein